MCFFITSQTNKKRTLKIKTMTELDETYRENCANWQICSAEFILIDGLIYSFRVCSAPYSVLRHSHDDKMKITQFVNCELKNLNFTINHTIMKVNFHLYKKHSSFIWMCVNLRTYDIGNRQHEYEHRKKQKNTLVGLIEDRNVKLILLLF